MTPRTSAGRRHHLVTVQRQVGAPVGDGDGAYIETWAAAAPPTWYVSLRPAVTADLERVKAGTVISELSLVVNGPYRPDVSTASRLLFNGRTLNVVSCANVDEHDRELQLVCVEVVH